MPGNRERVTRRPVADAVNGQHDDAHAQYGDHDERGDHEYGEVDAHQRERRHTCWGEERNKKKTHSGQ